MSRLLLDPQERRGVVSAWSSSVEARLGIVVRGRVDGFPKSGGVERRRGAQRAVEGALIQLGVISTQQNTSPTRRSPSEGATRPFVTKSSSDSRSDVSSTASGAGLREGSTLFSRSAPCLRRASSSLKNSRSKAFSARRAAECTDSWTSSALSCNFVGRRLEPPDAQVRRM